MEIPSIKTLIIYNYNGVEKRVLSEFIRKGDDKFASIEYANKVKYRNPFDIGRYTYSEAIEVGNNVFVIEYQNGREIIDTVGAKVLDVLEFNNRIFKLEETDYDVREYEDNGY